MAQRQFIYLNTDGDYEQGANTFEGVDFVNSSSGAGDAGAPIVLDAAGLLDASFIDEGVIDHDLLLNYVANEHLDWTTDISSTSTIDPANLPEALLRDGSRTATGILSYDSPQTFTSDQQIVSKVYVDDQISAAGTAAEWFDSAIDILLTPPVGPTTGDRYLITGGIATGAWTGREEDVAEWNGATWDFQTPTTGTYIGVDDETDGLYYFGGSTWAKTFFENTTASLGVEKVGLDIRLDIFSGGGIKLIGNEVAVEPDDFAGTGLVDDGSDNLAIDFSTTFDEVGKAIQASDLASTTNGEGASIIGIEDAGGFTTATDVEAALQEIFADLEASTNGVTYTAGTGGVSAGDMVFISGNDTVNTYSTITNPEVVVGIAETSAAAGGQVNVLANDTVITGILSSATAGTKYFWNGTGYTTNFASFTPGQYVYVGGVAKNATDVAVEVSFVARRS